MKIKVKYIFGYKGAKETNWLMASSYHDLVQQLDKKGMSPPTWYERLSA